MITQTAQRTRVRDARIDRTPRIDEAARPQRVAPHGRTPFDQVPLQAPHVHALHLPAQRPRRRAAERTPAPQRRDRRPALRGRTAVVLVAIIVVRHLRDVHVEVPHRQPRAFTCARLHGPLQRVDVVARQRHPERHVDPRQLPQLVERLDLPSPAASNAPYLVVQTLVTVQTDGNHEKRRARRAGDLFRNPHDGIGLKSVRGEVQYRQPFPGGHHRGEEVADVPAKEYLTAGHVQPPDLPVPIDESQQLRRIQLIDRPPPPDVAGLAAVLAPVCKTKIDFEWGRQSLHVGPRKARAQIRVITHCS